MLSVDYESFAVEKLRSSVAPHVKCATIFSFNPFLFHDLPSTTRTGGLLHSFIIRSAATLGHHPINYLVRVHDVAGLAVDAVGKVDLQFALAALFGHFVDRRGTVILAGIS